MAVADIKVAPIDVQVSLKDRIYESLKQAITSVNIYSEDAELRLDERQLSERMQISRTPLREALARLEQEGLVRIVPRRGVFIVRKTKAEILEMITVWAALESMAARLAAEAASEGEIAALRALFENFERERAKGHIDAYKLDEYSEANIQFHQAIIRASGSPLIREMTDNLFIHMRSIRARTIGEGDRAKRSISDHLEIIEALEARDGERAERLVREHALNLARHVKKNVDYLD